MLRVDCQIQLAGCLNYVHNISLLYWMVLNGSILFTSARDYHKYHCVVAVTSLEESSWFLSKKIINLRKSGY